LLTDGRIPAFWVKSKDRERSNGFRIPASAAYFQPVFGNFGQAMRLTLLLTLFSGAPMVLFVSKNTEAASQNIALIFVVVLPVWLFTYSWAAVGWHRYILP
jgi:hypothetical protein